jgi:hypothetical protein
VFDGLTFTNAGAGLGNGVVTLVNSTPTIQHCIFSQSVRSAIGSGAFTAGLTITNCQFINNSDHEPGGAIDVDDGEGTVANCTFTNNSTSYGRRRVRRE